VLWNGLASQLFVKLSNVQKRHFFTANPRPELCIYSHDKESLKSSWRPGIPAKE
jgi:hypothetical protein